MMTSVTLPSTSTIHGGYSTSVAPSEETSSEADFEIPRQAPLKRCLAVPSADSCKKRRKQSTPIRISATDIDSPVPSTSTTAEGRPPTPIDSSAVEPDYRCPVCQLYFDTSEQIQHHIMTEHSQIECKKEPEDYSNPSSTPTSRPDLELSIPRPEVQWMNEMQSKEWVNSGLPMPFNPSNPMFMSLPQYAQSESLPRQSIRIFNPDAYCDLCNKEFCNKYFLKTHKANKHGIYTDNPTSEPMMNPVNIPSYTGNVKFQTPVPTIENPTIKPDINPKPSSVVNQYSEPIFPSQFNKFPRITTKQNIFNEVEPTESSSANGFSSANDCDKPDDVQAEQSSSPRDLQTESTSFKNDPDGLYYDSSKMSPVSSRELDLSNRLKRIGVMNPKAFCEICCKEYCNKYFLRTHKMKRHGIYIPDDREKDFKMEGMSGFPWQQHNIQTSPLNLIMTEQNSQDRKTTSPNDISCEICGIKFQNANLAQLHNVTVHGKMFAREQEQSENTAEEAKKPENPTDKSINAEAISEDLQKLQTMILQLNDLDVTKVSTTCNACNKEFENRYYLHAHMMTEHGMLLEDMSEEKTGESENSSNNNTMCDLCGKDVQNVEEMKKHILEYHSNNQSGGEPIKEYTGFSTPEKTSRAVPGQLPERRISMNVTPTSSYCEICNKELCNKYFMKTHMQRMHGIEIENGAQIGGVVCDICNKELCSKYFLRVHKHNTHGIVEYGTSLLQPRKAEGDPPPPMILPESDNSLKPSELAELSHRYFTHFTEVCTICSRRFRSTKWLKAHLLSDHGQVGAEKWAEMEQQLQHSMGQQNKQMNPQVKVERQSPTLKIPNGSQDNPANVGIHNVLSSLFGVDESNVKTYQCSFCPFTTQLLPLLFVHERSHSLNSSNSDGATLKCPVCPQTFLQPELLQHHMFTQHPFLPLPPFFNGNNNSQGETSKEPSEAGDDCKSGEEGATSDNNNPKNVKSKKFKIQLKQVELPSEIGQSLKDVAKKSQLPATYALPQTAAVATTSVSGENQSSQGSQKEPVSGVSATSSSNGNGDSGAPSSPGYVMQAFLLEEAAAAERRVVPAVVFLPVLQKQPAPLSVTFTLTPA